MKNLNKNSKTLYTRVCGRCQKLFYTASKFSKICLNCDGSPKKIRNKFMVKKMKIH